VLVKDIAPGLASSFPFEPVDVKGTLFFVASDPLTGTELWKSDDTEPGTLLVKDFYPGTGNSWPSVLLNVNGMLFFNAADVVHGAELWKSDGTVAGTALVKDIHPGSSGSNPGANGIDFFESAEMKATLFFAADGGPNGQGLWKSDGTEAGTVLVKDIHPYRLLNVNGTLFFAGQSRNGDNTQQYDEWPRVGSKLWKSDGTPAGTVLVKDVELGDPGYGDFTEFVNVNGTLFFTSNGAWNGIERSGTGLWKSDGTTTGTVLVREISDLLGSNHQLLNVNGTLFMAGRGGVWKSEGTEAGTLHLRGGYAHDLANVNGTLFFGSNDGTHGDELWKSDGTAVGTVMVRDISPGPLGSYPSELVNVNGTLFFAAHGERSGGGRKELWKSDGTAEGTVMVKDIYPGPTGGSSPYQLLNANGTLFFNAVDTSHGHELWKSDGTESGTVLVKDIYPGVGDSLPSRLPFLYANGALFFPADDGEHGVQLWKYVPDSMSERPALKIARVGNRFTLSWPAGLSGFILEASTNLSSSVNWSKTPDTPTIVGSEYIARTTLTGTTNTFYRLNNLSKGMSAH
jgi:ELWxxDGT repeat protein